MDNEQAKFLLRSFRPDGADAGLEEFAEALQLAAENRELGEWLAQERADDALFADALNQVPIPESLREEILAVLEYDGNSQLGISDAFEGVFVDGLDAIQPPAGLRDQILASMELEKPSQRNVEEVGNVADVKVWRWLSVASMAAALAVGVFVSMQSDQTTEADRLVYQGEFPQVAVHNVSYELASKLTTPEKIGLNRQVDCTEAALDFLKGENSPVPAELPPGLQGARLVGCKNMYLESGQPVSLICFEKEGVGMVHLIALDSNSLADAKALSSIDRVSLKDCIGCSRTRFNIALWKDGSMTYMILTKAEKETMVKLF